MKRTLGLKRESLTDLTIDELTGVAGAGADAPSGLSCPVTDCAGITLPPRCYSVPWC